MKTKNKKHPFNIMIVLLLILIAAAAAAFVFFTTQIGKMNYVRDEDVERRLEILETETEPPLHAADVYHPEEVVPVEDARRERTTTFLIIGTAAPETEGEQRPQAQAVITMTINHNMKVCPFCNFNVNTYAEIPGAGPGRLGEAYAIGGGPLLAETILYNYGIPIDHYAAISMKDVAEAIDMPEFETLDVSSQGLDVVAELIYRLNALKPAEVAGYISHVLPFVTHNMTTADILGMVLQIPVIVPYYSERYQIPLEGMYRELDGYPVPDIGAMSERMQDLIYGDESEWMTETETALSLK